MYGYIFSDNEFVAEIWKSERARQFTIASKHHRHWSQWSDDALVI